jgi:hypothetical protein
MYFSKKTLTAWALVFAPHPTTEIKIDRVLEHNPVAHPRCGSLSTLVPLANFGSAIPIAMMVIPVMVVTVTVTQAIVAISAMVVAVPPATYLSLGRHECGSEQEHYPARPHPDEVI